MPAAHGATITVGLESANMIPVDIQLLNGRGKPLAGRAVVRAFISSDEDGLLPVNFVDDDSIPAVQTAGELLTDDDSSVEMISSAAGLINLTVENASDEAKTRYVNVVLGNGAVLPPVAITFDD